MIYLDILLQLLLQKSGHHFQIRQSRNDCRRESIFVTFNK